MLAYVADLNKYKGVNFQALWVQPFLRFLALNASYFLKHDSYLLILMNFTHKFTSRAEGIGSYEPCSYKLHPALEQLY